MAYLDKKKDVVCKAKWRKEHPELYRKASSNYTKRNQEKAREKSRRWNRNNPEKLLLSSAKRRAKDRGLEITIDVSDIVIPDVCPILGITIITGSNNGKQKDSSPSLDRIDNTKGYIKGNVWVISWRANKIKSNSSLEELEKMVIALRSKLKGEINSS